MNRPQLSVIYSSTVIINSDKCITYIVIIVKNKNTAFYILTTSIHPTLYTTFFKNIVLIILGKIAVFFLLFIRIIMYSYLMFITQMYNEFVSENIENN